MANAADARAERGAARSLAQSYAHCGRLARRAASSFYLSFWLLPAEQRRAMCALYAFFRHTDDLADGALPAGALYGGKEGPPHAISEAAVRRRAIARWKERLALAFNGCWEEPLLPAVVETVQRYRIPREYFWDAIAAAEMDLSPRRYRTAEDLEQYCHGAASVVGLACIHVWGFRAPAAIEYARQCGYAFQWTNILRDLAEDARRGRCYLPEESLARVGYSFDDLAAGAADERFEALLRLESGRARRYYEQGERLAHFLPQAGRRAFASMYGAYRELLARVEKAGPGVLARRVRVPRWRKLQIAASALSGRTPRSAEASR